MLPWVGVALLHKVQGGRPDTVGHSGFCEARSIWRETQASPLKLLGCAQPCLWWVNTYWLLLRQILC